MQFATPTTKTQMYEILKEIFNYYRFQPVAYDQEQLAELELPRMQFTQPTEAELTALATTALSSKHAREVADYENERLAEIAETQIKLNSLEAKKIKLLSELDEQYSASVSKAEREAVKKGIAYSDVVHERIVELEREKNQKRLAVASDIEDERGKLEAKLSRLNAEIGGAQAYFAPFHQKEITAKVDELRLEYEKTGREVFEYNNGLYRKEIEYANSLVRAKAGLELKYMELRSKGLSKDELIQMGYYNDVVACVTAYYDTLTPYAAYNDLLDEVEIAQYLDDFYQDVAFVYRSRTVDEQSGVTNA